MIRAAKATGFRDGATFKDGKLYVFERNSVLVVQPWPHLRAWRMTAGRRQWRQVRPNLFLEVSLDGVLSAPSTTPRRLNTICQPFPGARRRWDNDPFLDARLPFDEGPIDEPAARAHRLAEAASVSGWWEKQQARATAAVRPFQACFPSEVRAWLSPFRERQWHLAVLLRGCPGAAGLLQANPALAFCLASNWVFRSPRPKLPQRDARRWIRRRQRDIAGWLGFPALGETVNLLRKIPPEACSIPALLYLRHALRTSDVAATLRHFPRLDATVLRITGEARLRALVAPRLLRELSAGVRELGVCSGHVRMLRDMLDMAAMLVPARALPAYQTLRQLERAHDALAEELNLHGPRAMESVEFPAPPIPGHDGIVPLTAPEMLLEEGRAQQNCVASYFRRVADGGEFIYRVLAPERATLQVVRTKQGWQMGQLSGVRNRAVSDSTRAAVLRWMEGEGWNENWEPF